MRTTALGWTQNVLFLEQRFVTRTAGGGEMVNAVATPRLKLKFRYIRIPPPAALCVYS